MIRYYQKLSLSLSLHLHKTYRKWTSSAATLFWGWSRAASSIRRCPRCPSTTCCSSSCRKKVKNSAPSGSNRHHVSSAWIPAPSVPPTGSNLPVSSTIGRRPCHPRPSRTFHVPSRRLVNRNQNGGSGGSGDLFIDHRSMAPGIRLEERKNERGRPQPDL